MAQPDPPLTEPKPYLPAPRDHPIIPAWHHRHRWVLIVMALFVLAMAVYVAWRIIYAWEALLDSLPWS
jgi:hypothetical protein